MAVATKLVTCPALLLLDQPLGPLCQPSQAAAAQHLLTSLRTAAQQLHINVVVTAEALQDAAFGVVDNVVMLDQQARPLYVGAPQKVMVQPDFAAILCIELKLRQALPVYVSSPQQMKFYLRCIALLWFQQDNVVTLDHHARPV